MVEADKQRLHFLVRDLSWAVTSPELCLFDESIQSTEQLEQSLQQTRPQGLTTTPFQAEALWAYIERYQPRRLGDYFEALWRFYLIHSGHTELLAYNFPVYRQLKAGRKTLGAFDFIYWCHQRQQHIHLEVAVKFYLQLNTINAQGATVTQWLGPGAKDRLDIKYQHLQSRQLALSDTAEAKMVLQTLGVTAVQKEVALKGILFYPYDNLQPALEAGVDNMASCLHPFHQRGFWLHLRDIDNLLAKCGSDDEFYRLFKPHWLSDYCLSENQYSVTSLKAFLQDYFEQQTAPVLMAIQAKNSGKVERFFVCPDQWPNINAGAVAVVN